MSRRRSTGDLVPRDITEILAREARVQRSKKKAGSSLGQAFNWLKGSRRKKNVGNGLNRTGSGVTDAQQGLQNQDPTKAGPKGNDDGKRLAVHYKTSQHHQENVFIEGSRPQYLEDLHSEAQEGLKILQQEENKNGVNFTDDESISSSDTLRPEQDNTSKDGGGSSVSRASTGNTDTTVTSSVSTRPVLTRQGSTFKPLNPVKRLDKSRKRTRRTTIMGIPNHVQKELALNRSSTFQPLTSVPLPVNDRQIPDTQSGVVIIPTVNGGTLTANKEGARVHLSDLEASRDEQLFKKQLQAMYQDEQPLGHQAYGSHHYPTSGLRPKSLAVPSLTTSATFCPTTMCSFLQEPPGPVMSISPQATYLSTIIPNAVLPASIEVIEIDRSISRAHGSSVNLGGSVRTVSKSSLASRDSAVSPLLSRRSDGDGFQTDYCCNDSSQTPKSTTGSNWSESSRTMISDSSPVSSKSSTYSANSQRACLNGQESQQEHLDGDQDHVSLCSSVSGISNSKSESLVTVLGSESGSFTTSEDAKNKRNCARNLSVMKTKQPPAPPRRTNSLHGNKMRSSSGFLVESKNLNDLVSGRVEMAIGTAAAKDMMKSISTGTSEIPTPVSNSTGSSSPDVSSSPLSATTTSSKEAEGTQEPQSESSNSSPQKVLSEGGKFERTMSPSSGYSSQSGTPTLSPKGVSPTSPEKQKKPVKPERSASRAGSSSAASHSSSLTSLSLGTSEPVHPDVSTCSQNPVTSNELLPNNNSSIMLEFRELLNIPPPPKVKAPCPPPPETWAHNRRTFDLLCGPLLGVSKDTHKAPGIQENTLQQTGSQNETGGEMQMLAENQTAVVRAVFEPSDTKAKLETLVAADLEDNHEEKEERERPGAEIEGAEESADVRRQEQSPVLKSPKNPVTLNPNPQKKDPPPVMKKPSTLFLREEQASAEASVAKEVISTQVEVNVVVENNATSSQSEASVETADNDTDKSEVPPTQTLSVEGPKVNKVSPPPTPPPAHHPTPPPSRKTPPSSVSTPPGEFQGLQPQHQQQQQQEEEIQAVESCWPPPPPPLEGDSVFEGGDEVDFPPPPPPLPCITDVVEICVEKLDVPNECPMSAEEVRETNVSSSEAGTTEQREGPDLLVSQSAEDFVKLQDDTQLPKSNGVDDLSCEPQQSVSSDLDDYPPPLEEAPPAPPTTPSTNAEDTVPLPALDPSSSFLRRDSLKTGDLVSAAPSISVQTPCTVPPAPPSPAESITHGVNFRWQPSVANRDTRSKELLSRHKSAPIPKEDANIPLVTPSLLQMVRLRSVNVTEDQVGASSEDKPLSQGAPVQESCLASIPANSTNTPQKPIRKSLSLKSPPQMVKAPAAALSAPSMRLQEAIRMKTAAMSSRDGLPSRLGVRAPTFSCVSEPGALSLRSPDGYDMNKSPASTASFIFSRSTKKVVIETPAATLPEAQACLKQSLAAELMPVSDQSRSPALLNGGMRCDKVPPPVAKKPAHGSISSSQQHQACSGVMENSGQGNGAAVGGGGQHSSGITPPETTITRVTADTIETLF